MEADVVGVEGDEREDGEQWVPEEVLRRPAPGGATGAAARKMAAEQHAEVGRAAYGMGVGACLPTRGRRGRVGGFGCLLTRSK